MKFRLLTQTRNQMLSLAMLKVILRKKKWNNSGSSCKPQQSCTTGCNKWLINKLGTASRDEHKYSSFCRSSRRWTMKLFLHLLDLTVLNIWILLSSCGAKYTHREFRLVLVRKLIEEVEDSQNCPKPILCNSRVAITNTGQ